VRRLAVAAVLVAATAVTGPAQSASTRTLLDWRDLDGWADDDHAAALSVFLDTCPDIDGGDWTAICALAATGPEPRAFFELFFRPVLIEDGTPALFTGYYEPELAGSPVRTERFRFPIYRRPPELGSAPWLTRAQIEESGVLNGRGLEIAWLDDPVDKFFLQVQGSGRIRFPDGRGIRVGFGGKNGHPYRSIGQELVRRGLFQPHQVSAGVIRRWVRQNPDAGRLLLHANPSYVFFREVSRVPADKGPLGAMNRSITTGRTIAVDPDFVPLGAPVWIEKRGAQPIRRLMVAQDTGSAIKGAQRADIFYGTGDAAGDAAGSVRDPGRLVVLLPIETALAQAGSGD
jgi:membrane-bound lytic murein transglycosylase A